MCPASECTGSPMHSVTGWNTTKAWMTGSFEKRKKDTGRRHNMFGQIKGKLEFFSVSFLSG